ncbi:helix-turn-helix transcriptional regulator [Pseudomonas putida]|uniref:helix-turn-helix transcriptional regulator n=1 Tax=Pseudomonas putida TaxID=303 RepID=UPI002365E836|nr:LuxR C-terminal-related transcriptional regulator [Pseudomonas putida]MDD2050595.1 LuxR C-terminal-related transcriptional regulator [Pseudomonas putida]
MEVHNDKLLVSTKLVPPRIGTLSIPREKLVEQLQQLERCTVGLVVGSPGFGKTTLLVQWRQTMMRAGAEVAWLSLSADDKYLSTFFVYLRGALQRLGVTIDLGTPLEGASSESIDDVVAAIVEGASSINKELFLVLDDYQHVGDPRSHRLMQKLLDHSPANLHFVIAARVQPPLSLSRLRLMGQVVEPDCAGLPFEPGETRAFLERNLVALKLNEEEIHLLHELTSGWPATLQLIVILLRNHPDARATLRELGWRSDDLQSYLAEDVMAHLPPQVVDFMESISICRRFSASLAEAVTGDGTAQKLLKRLEEENLLIFRVEADDRLPWYRFHPLFNEFLSTRLLQRSKQDIAQLHQRAARWFAERNLLAEAVRHATLGADLRFAIAVIERSAPTSWSLDQLSPMLRLLDRLPQNVLFSHPRLFFIGCLAYALTARPVKAQAWLTQFQRSGVARGDDVEFRLPLIQAAILVQQDNTEPVIELLRRFRPLADDYSVMRYGPPALLALAYSAAGRHSDALRSLDENPVPEADRDDEMALLAEGTRGLCSLMAGRMGDAERLGAALLTRAVAVHGHRSASAYVGAAMLAEVYCELNRIDEAREILANRNGLLQWTMPDSMMRASICRARLDLLQESPAAAQAFLERQGRHFCSIGLDRPLVHCLAEQVRIAVLDNDLSSAQAHVCRLEGLGQAYPDAAGFRAEIPAMVALAKARLLLASNAPGQALEQLERVGDYAQKYLRGQLGVTTQLLMAIAQANLEQQQAADHLLTKALETGNRLGLVRTFLDEGAPLSKLLATLVLADAPDSSLRGYLTGLLSGFGYGEDGTVAGTKADAAAQSRLTPRELAILQLIGQAMSNKRVALTLNISLETVKWNLKNIYYKASVSSRYDAVSWARRRALLP